MRPWIVTRPRTGSAGLWRYGSDDADGRRPYGIAGEELARGRAIIVGLMPTPDDRGIVVEIRE
jgi:hypothetical protein